MALIGATFTLSSKEQFLAELHEHGQIEREASLDQVDYSMQSLVIFASHFYEDFLIDRLSGRQAIGELLQSPLWNLHSERHCHTLVGLTLTKQQKPAVVSFCLEALDVFGRDHPFAHRLLRKPHPPAVQQPHHYAASTVVLFLINTISNHRRGDDPQDSVSARLPWLCTEVLYETCRHTRLSSQDLAMFSEDFVIRLFELVELTRDERDETFNYTLIKLIIALNEQFMVSSLQTTASATKSKSSLSSIDSKTSPDDQEPNVVLRTIREFMGAHKTFGENLIFILNRCGETEEDGCISLLILKILYLLFTSTGTSEYFYTNDLCVLVDIFIRELHDLSEENNGLRHTFLRVLHPLMTSTQLRMVPYKREELRRLLRETVTESSRSKVNATTKRLVQRNLEAPWSKELGAIDMVDLPDSPLSPTIAISYVASPHSSSSGLPSTSFDHHTTVKSEPTVRKNAEAAAALEELKLTYPSTRCHRHFTDDDFSRRGSTVSTNSLASQQSVAVASTVVGPNGSAVDSDDLSSPIGSNIARPSSTGSTASSISNKRKPPPIPPLKKTQQQQLHSLQPLTLDVDADSSNGMFRRRLKSEATGSKPKRAPPPIPFDKKKHIRQQEARVESPAR